MKPESRGSFLNRSFRRSFKKKKVEEQKPSSSGEPNEEEKKAVKELHDAITDVIAPHHNENVLRRFLSAKSFDVKEAEKLFRLDINFRKLLSLDELDPTQFPEATKYGHISGIIGFDKEGAPIRVINIGVADLRGAVHSMSTIGLLKIVLYFLIADEKLLEEINRKSGKNATQVVCIFNLDGLSTAQILYKPVLDTALMGIKLFQEHFPDFWKSVFVINAPSYFSSVYKLLRPVIQDELHRKVQVYTDNWKDVLLEHIDAEVLPELLGGTNTDNKEFESIVSSMSKVPESLYVPADGFLDPNEEGVETITIPAGGFVKVPIPVLVPESNITYMITSKDYDISLGLFYEPNASTCHIEKFKKKEDAKEVLAQMEQLTPVIRTQCQLTPEVGEIFGWKKGIYVIYFDNTYSWMNAKQVTYKLDVKLPESTKLTSEPDLVQDTKNLTIASENRGY